MKHYAWARRARGMGLPCALGFASFIGLKPCWAATFTVTTTLDEVDAHPGDGECRATSGHCSLRAAVQESNASVGADLILMRSGTYTLRAPPTYHEEADAAYGDLDVQGSLAVRGSPGGAPVIQGGGLGRIFDCPGGSSVNLSLSNLRLERGNTLHGGAIRSTCNLTVIRVAFFENRAIGAGGAIRNDGGALTVQSSWFDGNFTNNDAGAIYSRSPKVAIMASQFLRNWSTGSVAGAVLAVDGRAVVSDSFFSSNWSADEGGAALLENPQVQNTTFLRNYAPHGGALSTRGTSFVVNSTFFQNGNSHTQGGGGAVWVGTGNLVLNNATFYGNSSHDATISVVSGRRAEVSNSLFLTSAGPLGHCSGVVSRGHNVFDGGPCGIAGMGDALRASLGTDTALRANGSPLAPTLALMPGSPAVGAGRSASLLGGTPHVCSGEDSRHLPRPGSIPGCDVGAYELCRASDPTDSDVDGLADDCDADDDNDGCIDAGDQHPRQANILLGYVNAICQEPQPIYQYEGSDSDWDGLLDCEDDDDDDDGIYDDQDDPLALSSNPDWDCFEPIRCGPECAQFLIRIVSVSNPVRQIVFNEFSIGEGTYYVRPSPGTTAADAVTSLLELGGSKLSGGTPDLYKVEVWTKDAKGAPSEFVALVGEFDATAPRLDKFAPGQFVGIRFPKDKSQGVALSTSFAPTADPNVPDADSDGVPNSFDNCPWDANENQLDGDLNGLGDVCG